MSTWVGAARGHGGQQPISISPPGSRDLGRARGSRGGGPAESALPAGSSGPPPHPAPPPPAGNRPSPSPHAPPSPPPRSGPCSPGARRGPGARAESPRARERERGCGWAAARAPRPWQRGDWRRFGSHFLQLPRPGLGGVRRRLPPPHRGGGAGGARGGRRGRRPATRAGAGARGGRRCRAPLPPLQCRQSGAAPRGERPRSHPFPAILYPGWRLPKAEPPQTKPGPGPPRAPAAHRAGRPGGPGVPTPHTRFRPTPLGGGGAEGSPPQGGSACDGHSAGPRRLGPGPPFTPVAGLDPSPRRSPPRLREGGDSPRARQ